ncbi:MAG: WG repeat-containing protein, partial [Clostridia bacterium]
GHYIDLDGQIAIDCSLHDYIAIGSFSEGFARYRKDGKFGYIDVSGSIAIEAKWTQATDFINGIAWVEFDDLKGCIDKHGHIVSGAKFSDE